jgi:hypothetical protein
MGITQLQTKLSFVRKRKRNNWWELANKEKMFGWKIERKAAILFMMSFAYS